MIRGTVDRERLEGMVRMFQHDIQSRRDWCDRGWISEAIRDQDIARITGQMSTPLRLLGFVTVKA